MKKKTPLRAIKEKCLDCCCYNRSEVDQCTVTLCALYDFRNKKARKNSKIKQENDGEKENDL